MAKKISKNVLSLVMKEIEVKIYYNGSDGEFFTVKKVIPLTDMLNLVKDVAENVVDLETYSYDPEYRDFALRQAVVEYYTDLELPKDVAKRYDLLYRTNLYRKIYDAIDYDQFDAIEDAITDKINSMKEIINSHMFREVNKILSTFGEITEMFSALSNNMNPEDVAGLFGKIAEIGSINEESVANALVESLAAAKAVETNG